MRLRLGTIVLPGGGIVLGCNIREALTFVAQRFWREGRIEEESKLRLASELEALEGLLVEYRVGTFNFAFKDFL